MRITSAAPGLAVWPAVVTPAQDHGRASPSPVQSTLSRLSIDFIENKGVDPDEVAYHVQGADKSLLLTKEEITFRLNGKDQAWVVKPAFVTLDSAAPSGIRSISNTFSFLIAK